MKTKSNLKLAMLHTSNGRSYLCVVDRGVESLHHLLLSVGESVELVDKETTIPVKFVVGLDFIEDSANYLVNLIDVFGNSKEFAFEFPIKEYTDMDLMRELFGRRVPMIKCLDGEFFNINFLQKIIRY